MLAVCLFETKVIQSKIPVDSCIKLHYRVDHLDVLLPGMEQKVAVLKLFLTAECGDLIQTGGGVSSAPCQPPQPTDQTYLSLRDICWCRETSYS